MKTVLFYIGTGIEDHERALSAERAKVEKFRDALKKLRDVAHTKDGITLAAYIDGYLTTAPVPVIGFVDIVFDGPPGPTSGRFVEVENSHGASINFGEWVQRPDGYWVLRIAAPQPTSKEGA